MFVNVSQYSVLFCNSIERDLRMWALYSVKVPKVIFNTESTAHVSRPYHGYDVAAE